MVAVTYSACWVLLQGYIAPALVVHFAMIFVPTQVDRKAVVQTAAARSNWFPFMNTYFLIITPGMMRQTSPERSDARYVFR
jgi:hypothetical protein